MIMTEAKEQKMLSLQLIQSQHQFLILIRCCFAFPAPYQLTHSRLSRGDVTTCRSTTFTTSMMACGTC
jgi:hypothetical protein